MLLGRKHKRLPVQSHLDIMYFLLLDTIASEAKDEVYQYIYGVVMLHHAKPQELDY
jgi:hypothetical protein